MKYRRELEQINEIGNRILEPYKSIHFPIQGLVIPETICLEVDAHPKKDLPIKSSSPIGFMNNPKFKPPKAIDKEEVTAITITMFQP